MYCRQCGHEVRDNDRFCPNCGARVPIADTGAVRDAKMKWNIRSYPSERKETERVSREPVDFDWKTDENEFGGAGGEVPFAPYLKKHEEFRGFKSDETIRLEREAAERAEKAAKEAEEKAAGKAAAERTRTPGAAPAADGGSESAAADADHAPEETREEMIKRLAREGREREEAKRREAELRMRRLRERRAAEEQSLAEEEEAKRRAEEEEKRRAEEAEKRRIDNTADIGPAGRDIEGAELEKVLFDEIEKDQGSQIDKFYTFNKKNEEFQKLLDREYEKFSSGRDVIGDDEFRASAVAVISSEEDLAEEEALENSSGDEEDIAEELPPHVREMERAQEAFFGEESGDAPDSDEKPAGEVEFKEAPASGENEVASAPEDDEEAGPEQEEEAAAETTEEPAEDGTEESESTEAAASDEIPETESGEEPSEAAEEEPANMPDETETAEETPEEIQEEGSGQAAETEAEEETLSETAAAAEAESPDDEAAAAAEAESTDDEVSGDGTDTAEKKKSRIRITDVVIAVLVILIVMEIAALAIRYTMPGSAFAQWMDRVSEQIMRFFSGGA